MKISVRSNIESKIPESWNLIKRSKTCQLSVEVSSGITSSVYSRN